MGRKELLSFFLSFLQPVLNTGVEYAYSIRASTVPTRFLQASITDSHPTRPTLPPTVFRPYPYQPTAVRHPGKRPFCHPGSPFRQNRPEPYRQMHVLAAAVLHKIQKGTSICQIFYNFARAEVMASCASVKRPHRSPESVPYTEKYRFTTIKL